MFLNYSVQRRLVNVKLVPGDQLGRRLFLTSWKDRSRKDAVLFVGV